MKIQIYSKIQILLGLIAGVTASFLQSPSNQFQSTFNSTFLTEHARLFRPIVIPNATELSERSLASKPSLQKLKAPDDNILKNILRTELSNEENDSGEEFKPSENRFSSRYSSKEETDTKADDGEEAREEKVTSITDIPLLLERGEPIASKISLPSPPNAESFSDRSDTAGDSEEEKADGRQYPDSSEAREREESEITSTTNEPYSELRTPTSIRTSPDEHFENYETSSGVADESDDSEEKRSIDDYDNSGSKNYHSIQTPLNQIKYRGPQSFSGEFDLEKIKKPTPNRLRLIKHNWPYTREKLKAELEENEISDDGENKSLETEEWTSEEEPRTPKTNFKDVGLELAVHRDENKFDRIRAYNYIDDRKQRKEQERNLAKEEEKDRKSPFYKTLKHYTVDEEEPKHQPTEKFAKAPKKKQFEKTPRKKPKNIFFNYTPGTATKPAILNSSKELTLDFPVHRYLGPVVFDKDNSNIQTTTTKSQPKVRKPYNVSPRNYIKNLEQKEKLDQDNLRIQKAAFSTEDAKYQSFNHLEESDEMYNAILANIQSVFGLRTQPLRVGGERKNQPEVSSEESNALTWSVPSIKRQTKPYRGVLESVTLKGSDGKVKSGSEGAPKHRKFTFPVDIIEPEKIGNNEKI